MFFLFADNRLRKELFALVVCVLNVKWPSLDGSESVIFKIINELATIIIAIGRNTETHILIIVM
jgi:hypothetical protein